jgi:hypothetical protein
MRRIHKRHIEPSDINRPSRPQKGASRGIVSRN